MSNRRRTSRRARRGLTLLELTIATVIIVTGSVFMLGLVRKAQRAGEDLTCQSNLAQIGQALLAYAVQNNGSYPYGYYYDPRDPVTWQATGPSSDLVGWPEVVNAFLSEAGRGKLSARYRCPQAVAHASIHPVSYVMNMIVGVAPDVELRYGAPPSAQLKPSRIPLMLREGTAVVWDTAVSTAWDAEELGYLLGADIDAQRFWRGAGAAQYRYFDPADPYGRVPPGTAGQNVPVAMGSGWRNVDGTVYGLGFPYQGNLRFRHADQTRCNVAFSDGSVRQFTAVLRADLTMQSHDALRRAFMTHWPPNTPRNFSVP